MTAFADSSALVKLYVPEAGHRVVHDAEPLVVSQLARVEVFAAFWRKHRIGEIDGDDAAALAGAFEADLAGDDETSPRFAVVALTDEVTTAAVALVHRHDLRAYDAVQLATALAAGDAVPECDTVIAFDERLRRAAAVEGLAVLPRRT